MKRSLVLATLATVAATSAMAQSNVTVYGRVNTTVESQKDVAAAGNLTVLQNNSSRWGLKGSEDLGGGMKANFLLESGFASDTGANTGGALFARESWVGLSGSFGAVKFGNLTPATALYYATSDYIGMHNHETGTSSDAFYIGAGVTGKNAMSYATPNMGGAVLELQYGLKETKAAGAKDTVVLVGTYQLGALYLGGGYSTGPSGFDGVSTQKGTEFGLAALYAMGPFTVGTTFIRNEMKDPTDGTMTLLGKVKRDSFRVSGMYALGSSEFHLNIGMAGKIKVPGMSSSGTDAMQYTLAYNYNLSKRTKVYTFYSAVKNKENAAYNTYADGKDPSYFAVGLRHNF
jgi:predicted porin